MKYQQDIKTTGEIKADENRVFHINSMVSGRVLKDKVNLGDIIQQGQVLALVQNYREWSSAFTATMCIKNTKMKCRSIS